MSDRLLGPPQDRSAPERGEQATRDRHSSRPALPSLLSRATIMLLLVLITASTAFAVSLIRPSIYGAEAQILFRLDTSDAQRAERELATQQVILEGRDLLAPIAEAQDRSVDELRSAIDIELVGESDVLRLEVVDQDPARALQTAEALLAAYVVITADLPDATVTALEGDATTRADEIRELDLMTVELGSQTSADLHLIAVPSLLDDPVAPDPFRAAAVGGLVGVLLALAFAGAVGARLGWRLDWSPGSQR